MGMRGGDESDDAGKIVTRNTNIVILILSGITYSTQYEKNYILKDCKRIK